jgi:hypothetical protein
MKQSHAHSPGAAGRLGPWTVWPVLALALGVRVVRAVFTQPGGDECLSGLTSMEMLRGNAQVFFLGQDYMGTLDALLTLPVFPLVGPHPLVEPLLAGLSEFAMVVVIYLCLRRLFSFPAALVGLLYLALPPATLIFWSGEGMNHYHLGMLLMALLLWLTLVLWREGLTSKRSLVWGLLAGLAGWTNFQTAVVVLPSAVFALATRWREIRPLPILAAVAGGLAGGAPLLYFNLTHGFGHAGLLSSFDLAQAWLHLNQFLTNALPIVLGFNTPAAHGHTAPGHPLFWAYLAAAVLVAVGAWLLVRRGFSPERRARWLPVLVALCNVALVLLTSFGWELGNYDQRYLLPLYLCLPFAWAALAQAADGSGRRRWAAVLLVAAMLALNLHGWFGFRGLDVACVEGRYLFGPHQADLKRFQRMREAGLHHIYRYGDNRYAFLAGQDPQFSHAFEARRFYASVEVDAAVRPGFEMAVAPSLRFLGVDWNTWQGSVLHGFSQPVGADRMVPRQGWRARSLRPGDGAEGAADLGEALSDGGLHSGFLQRTGPSSGSGFTLDLGRERLVGGLLLVTASHTDGPSGLRVEAAGSGGAYETVAEEEEYRGPFYLSGPHPFLKLRYPRVECYFPPRPVQRLRITHLGGRGPTPWRVAEVMLLGPGEAAAATDWEAVGRELVSELKRGGARRVYADAWPSAVARLGLGESVWTLPANRSTSDYGFEDPPPEQPVRVEPGKGSAVVVHRRAAEQARKTLAGWRIPVVRESRAGPLLILWLGGRETGQRVELAAVRSNSWPEQAAALASGRPERGRWSSGDLQRPGYWLELEMEGPQEVSWVELANPDHPHDWPRGLRWEAAGPDGAWRTVHPAPGGPVVHAGPMLAHQGTAAQGFHFDPPLRASRLRLTLTGSHAVYWWSVQEVAVYGPGVQRP